MVTYRLSLLDHHRALPAGASDKRHPFNHGVPDFVPTVAGVPTSATNLVCDLGEVIV